jgi:hypothetical protein
LLPTMVPSLSSRLPSLVGCFRCPSPPILAASHGRRHQQSFTLTASTLTSLSSSPGPSVVVAAPPAVGQRAIAVVATAAAVWDDTNVRLRVIVVIVLVVVPAFSFPHRSQERRLPPLCEDLPPGDRRPRIGRWRRDVLLASPRSRDPPQSDPLSNVVAPQLVISVSPPPPNNDSVLLLCPSPRRRRHSPHHPPSNNLIIAKAAAAAAAAGAQTAATAIQSANC